MSGKDERIERWRSYERIPNSELRLDHNAVRNGVLFLRADCSSSQHENSTLDVDKEFGILENLARANGIDNIAIIGGCDESDSIYVRSFVENIRHRSSLELVWIDYELTKCLDRGSLGPMTSKEMIDKYLLKPSDYGFELRLNDWYDAKHAELILPSLVNQAQKIKGILEEQEEEALLLKKYPEIRRALTIKMFYSEIGATLFKNTNRTSEEKAIICFDVNRQHAVIVTESKQLTCVVFSTPEKFTVTMNDTHSDLMLEVKLSPESFKATPNSISDPKAPNQTFIPLIDRIKPIEG